MVVTRCNSARRYCLKARLLAITQQHIPFDYAECVLLRNYLVDIVLEVGKLFNKLVFDAFLYTGLELRYAGHAGVFKSRYKAKCHLESWKKLAISMLLFEHDSR